MSATVQALGAAVHVAPVEDGDWLDRVEAVCLAPSDLAARLHELADIAEICRTRPDAVVPAGALALIRDTLHDLAWRVLPS